MGEFRQIINQIQTLKFTFWWVLFDKVDVSQRKCYTICKIKAGRQLVFEFNFVTCSKCMETVTDRLMSLITKEWVAFIHDKYIA